MVLGLGLPYGFGFPISGIHRMDCRFRVSLRSRVSPCGNFAEFRLVTILPQNTREPLHLAGREEWGFTWVRASKRSGGSGVLCSMIQIVGFRG